ncbi:hypothetical protein BD626DRAFT_500945 [Schizophyllum amplum]|uniref:Uncharacterized protein n=1 Tax=Schizophyllum amplum TaxID=97359 RepID=A0A550C9D1_9AGAR|nr:hypothetical protein BD626DRAFT_500945 [Auriculariopsis ampla]
MCDDLHLIPRGLVDINFSSSAAACAADLLKLLPQGNMDARLRKKLDALAERDAALRTALEADPNVFVVNPHLAYCIKCETQVPLATHYSMELWKQHLQDCIGQTTGSDSRAARNGTAPATSKDVLRRVQKEKPPALDHVRPVVNTAGYRTTGALRTVSGGTARPPNKAYRS